MRIWVNGCFDILHTGHLDLLKFAKYKVAPAHHLSNKLFVGIDSDRRVKELKGETRPINSQEERKKMLESLRVVNKVHIFDNSNELRQLIKDLMIDYIVVGDEYRDKEVIGSENSFRGVVFYKVDERSTTNIIEKIKNS